MKKAEKFSKKSSESIGLFHMMDTECAKCSGIYYIRVGTICQNWFSFKMHVTKASRLSQNQGLLQKRCATWTSCVEGRVDCWFIPGNQPNCCSKYYKSHSSFQQQGAHQLWRLLNRVDAIFAMLPIPNGQTVDCHLRKCFSMPKMQ